MTKQQNNMELAEKTAGSNYTLNNGFLGGKKMNSNSTSMKEVFS